MQRFGSHTFAMVVLAAACGNSESNKSPGAGDGDPAGAFDSAGEVCVPAEPFDPAGCLEVAEFDPEAKGRWPNIERRQFDERGNERSRDTRGGEEADTERICRTEWDGDNILSEQCAGVAIYRYDYVYSSDGHLESSSYDVDADGVVEKVWTYSTDASGNVVEVLVDNDADGVSDAIQTFAWDGEGNLLEETWDYTYDGTIDFQRSFVWADGRLVQELEDSDGDGSIDVDTVTTYDDLGQISRVERFEGGSSTAAETSTWSYVDCALDTKVTFDSGGNRVTTTYWVDDLGRVVFEQEDFNGDGAADRVWATEWICPG